MDEEYKQYVKYGEEDDDPNSTTPEVSLEITTPTGSDELYLTSEFPIFWTIHQHGEVLPIDVLWDPFTDALSKGQAVLLELGEAGPRRVEVPPLSYVPTDPWPIVVGSLMPWSAVPLPYAPSPMGESVVHVSYLTANYQMRLCPGKTYALVWPGQTSAWALIGSDGAHGFRDPPCLLPASSAGVITFRVKNDSIPWPRRPEVTNEMEFERANRQELAWRSNMYWRGKFPPTPPRCPSQIVHGAPFLHMSISAPSEWSVNGPADITITVTYSDGPYVNSGPIAFYNHSFYQGDYGNGQNGIALYRLLQRSDGTKKWKRCQSKYTYYIAPRPPFYTPESIKVGDALDPFADRFTTLFPGQSWSITRRFHAGPAGRPYENTLPADVKPGDKFMYMFNGVTVAWWDRGTKVEHLVKGTVYSPTGIFFNYAWVERMQEEADKANGGRPRLLVPASNQVKFTMVE